MGGSGRVGFVILWPKPNPIRYKKNFVTPTHQALKTDPTRRVGLSWVGFNRSVGFLHTPRLAPCGEAKLKVQFYLAVYWDWCVGFLWVFSYIFNLKLVYWDWCQCTVASYVDNYTCMWDHSFTFIFFWVEIEF